MLLEDSDANIFLPDLEKLRRVNKFLAPHVSYLPQEKKKKKNLFWTKENEEKLPSSTRSPDFPSKASC